MAVDPQVQALLDQMAAAGAPPMDTLSPEEARAMMLEMRALAGEPEPVAKVEDRTVPGPAGDIPVRVYTPEGSGPFPVLVYFHGGGWVIGSIETSDGPCRQLTNEAGCVVVSVEYRLAPEHKFPAAPEDCYAVTRYVAERAAEFNADPGRLAVGGDSAGGNLAAVVALMARDRGGPAIVEQMLIYPVTDLDFNTPSYTENEEGFLLTKRSMVWFWDHYLPSEADGQNAYASPLRAADLSGLPPAFVATCELDPLRDEGESYAARLREAGVGVTAKRYEGLIHGAFQMCSVLDQGKTMMTDATAGLRRAFAQEPQPA
ncbi:MAG: alpha/beta hydrolase [Dehalococcoidia bacterium]